MCDGGSVLSACLSEYLSVCLFMCLSASLSLHSSADPDGLSYQGQLISFTLACFYLFDLFMAEKYAESL